MTRPKAANGEGRPTKVLNPDGTLKHWKTQFTLKDHKGNVLGRPLITGKTQKEVTDKRDALKRKAMAGRGSRDKALTVPQVVEEWLAGNSRGKAVTTLDTYDRALRLHIRPMLNIPAENLTPARIKDFIQDVADSAKGPGVVDGRSSAMNAWTTLHAAIEWAASAEVGRLTHNPMAGMRFPLGKARRRSQVPLADVGDILQASEGKPSNLVWRVFMATGARRGEVLGMNVQHVDLRKQVFKIRQIASPESGGRQISARLKGKTTREIRIPKELLADLGRQIEGRGPNEPLFPGPRSKRLSFATCREWFIRDMKAAGMDEYTIHQLRHTFASFALGTGQPVIVVSRILGHANVATTTDIYGHVTADQMNTAVDTLSESLAVAVASAVANRSTTQPSIPVLAGV